MFNLTNLLSPICSHNTNGNLDKIDFLFIHTAVKKFLVNVARNIYTEFYHLSTYI